MEMGPLVPTKKIFLSFLPNIGKEAIWSCDQHYINISSFSCTLKVTYKIWSKKVKWFLRKSSFNFDMKMTLGQSQEMTLTLNTHDFAKNKSRSNPGSSFEQTMMCWSPRCYISSLVEICRKVLEKMFDGFLTYMGMAATLAM